MRVEAAATRPRRPIHSAGTTGAIGQSGASRAPERTPAGIAHIEIHVSSATITTPTSCAVESDKAYLEPMRIGSMR